MVHQGFVILTYISLGLIVGAPLLALAGDLIKHLQTKWRSRYGADLYYKTYAANQAIRTIRRRAVQELLSAEREHRELGDSGEIIESTAVEVRR
jgi:hypothetical protein